MFIKYRSLFAVGICSVLLFSCKKSTEIGFGILPSSDDINAVFTDTFKLITTPMREDSVKTSSLFNNLVGNMYDPVFGKTYAAIFTEFRLPTTNIDLGDADTLFIDSVVLTLLYSGSYGYEEVPQSISVYEITESMNPEPEEGYFSNKSFSVEPGVLGRAQLVVPDLSDTISSLGQLFPPHLRIRLSDRFGQELLDQSGTENLANDTAFKNFFHGLKIAPDTMNTPYSASLIYLNLHTITSGLRLYWHTPQTDSNTLVFPITIDEVTTNYYKHSFGNSTLARHLKKQSVLGDSLIFVQPLAGVQTRVTIPYIQDLHDVIINKAELIVLQVYDPERSDTVYEPPVRIIVATLDSAGKLTVIPDDDSTNPTFPFFGGDKEMVEIVPGDTIAQYRFNISTQVQRVIDDKITDYGLFLIPSGRGEVANRLMGGGSRREDAWKMKLNIIYTPIE